ncbi:MAG: hypothetical protein WAK17_28385, partial [Candidatus Nitrosopolaris sp.]
LIVEENDAQIHDQNLLTYFLHPSEMVVCQGMNIRGAFANAVNPDVKNCRKLMTAAPCLSCV